MTPFEVSVRFFLELAVILCACRVVGLVARRLGQPQVVAEMVTGVLLGPSLLGMAWDGQVVAWLFPKECKPVIYTLAQVGLVLYMFLVGVEFRTDHLKKQFRAAASVSVAGMVVPFVLGAGIGLLYWRDGALFGDVTPLQAGLFMGAALSITAFPMLARIIHESGLSGTRLGTLTLAAGSVNDALAWCVLAVMLASFKHDSMIAVKAIGGGVAYGVVVLVWLRPVLRLLAKGLSPIVSGNEWPISPAKFSVVLMLLALGAWFTDLIEIYAVFGAFVLGLAMPRGEFANRLQRMLGPVTTAMLVPLFFVWSGLNTKVTLIDSWAVWSVALVVLGAACLGKFVSCAGAARLSGEGWRESLTIGALMNCRGMMELIILNIGLERGVITPTMFSIGVMMAVVTTLMATPLFSVFYGRKRAAAARAAEESVVESKPAGSPVPAAIP